MIYNFIGKVISTYERPFTKKNGEPGKNWEAVIEHENDGQHAPRKVLVSIWDENVWNAIAFARNSGDAVKVSCNIDSREYNGKWYNDIRAWKAELVQQTAQQVAPQIGQPMPMQQNVGFTAPAQPMPMQSSNPTIFDGNGASVQGNANTGNLPF